MFFFFKQKTAYEMRISDWSSDVCSSDLHAHRILDGHRLRPDFLHVDLGAAQARQDQRLAPVHEMAAVELGGYVHGQVAVAQRAMRGLGIGRGGGEIAAHREEHLRSEERGVGKECVSTCRARGMTNQ